MNKELKARNTFRRILLLLALMILADGISTLIALSLGYREGNPIVNLIGGPGASLMIRAACVLAVLIRSEFWDRPNRITVIGIAYIPAVLITGLVAAHNFYLVGVAI